MRRISVLGEERQNTLRFGLSHLLRDGLVDNAVVLVPRRRRPLRGQRQIDRRHRTDALERPYPVGIPAVLLPQPDQDLLGKGPLLVETRGRDRLPLRRRLTRLLGIVISNSPSPSSAGTPVKRYPSLRMNAYFVPGTSEPSWN